MHLFTNTTKSKFYVTSAAALNPIKIDGVGDIVKANVVCNPLTLLGFGELRVCDDGELVDTYNMPDDDLEKIQAKSERFEVEIIEHLSGAEIAKQILEAFEFDEQINLLRALRLCWNFDCDYEENTEWISFTTDDDSKLIVGINDSDQTVCCDDVEQV